VEEGQEENPKPRVRHKRTSLNAPRIVFNKIEISGLKPNRDKEKAMAALVEVDFDWYWQMREPDTFWIRRDIQGKYEENTNVEVMTSGFLLDAVETLLASATKTGNSQGVSARSYLDIVLASRGLLVQSSFVQTDTYDASIARRYWTNEDVKNVLDFIQWMRYYELHGETSAALCRNEPILRGFLAYHLWLEVSRRDSTQSPGGDWRNPSPKGLPRIKTTLTEENNGN